jgi:hypothetical protein
MKNRKLFNTAIVRKLQELVEEYPDLRFGQILVNAGIIELQMMGDRLIAIDPFNEEPEIMWERMKNNKFVFNEFDN